MTLPPPPPGVLAIRSLALEAWVLPYGARLMQLWWLAAPEGPRPLTLGLANPADYRQDRASLGAVCGRYANRIANATLERHGQRWLLDANHPLGHCIHGGREGTGVLDWSPCKHTPQSLSLQLSLADGHMGFPGACHMQVRFDIDDRTLSWQVEAALTRDCPINVVQHSYWHLDNRPDLSAHRLTLPKGSHYWPTDERELPTVRTPVDGTCLDFRGGAGFAPEDIDTLDASIELCECNGLRPAGTLEVPDLALDLYTDRPNLHVYASRYLSPTATALGVPHQKGAAVCLETEDLPNGPALGAPVWYGPERPYRHQMRFSLRSPSEPGPAATSLPAGTAP